MATIHLTHAPILSNNVQLLVLPVNTAGMFLDPILARTKSLYPDNYQHYRKACINGSLKTGTCLIHKCVRAHSGLGVGSPHRPSYIVNLVIADHPYHPARTLWLIQALTDLSAQLMTLIRYQGVRKVALFARPLLFDNASTQIDSASFSHIQASATTRLPLDWQDVTLPLIIKHLQALPKLHIDIHVPKSVKI